MISSYKAGKNAIAVLVTALMAAVTVTSGPALAQAPTAAPAQKAPPRSGASAQGTTKKTPSAARAYDRALLKPALLKDKAPEQYKVKFVTTRGEFTLDVTRAWAPLGADRFYNLVKHHFYDKGSVFRVVPGFVAQFGISAYPAVTTAWKGTDIKDDPVTQTNKKGYITFATAGPNTRTTHQSCGQRPPRPDGFRAVRRGGRRRDEGGRDVLRPVRRQFRSRPGEDRNGGETLRR